MGKYNSSIYRVRPLMEVIEKDYDAFIKLLSLVGIEALAAPGSYHYDGVGRSEKQLKPGQLHLAKLIRYISQKSFGNSYIANKNRRLLCIPEEGNPLSREAARDEALALLDENYASLTATGRKWFVFEGFTSPDIFIEGDDYVIVCEGKWTEPHITVETANLKLLDGEYRSQMVRHIQGALNYSDKRVYAFYIVDKGCSYLSELERGAFERQLNRETIALDNDEKQQLSEAFYGYTTWQDIEAAIGKVQFPSKENIR